MRFVLFLFLFLISCQTTLPDAGYSAKVDPRLKAQLAFSVDGVLYPSGVSTVQRQSLSKISVRLPAQTTLVLVNTCARQEEFWAPDPKKEFVYSYMPAFEAENMGSCPMYLTAITAQGEWYRAIIDWTNSPAKDAAVSLMCNGVWEDKAGSGICQVAEQLPIWVDSVLPAVFTKDPTSSCPEPEVLSPLHKWKITTKAPGPSAPGLCVYVLRNKEKGEFRLTTAAYSSILRVFPPTK